EFLNNDRDEILFEIFIRLPNGQSAFQYSSVCKRWYSIICTSTFIRSFIHIHGHICPQFLNNYYCSRPFTLLFRRDERNFYLGEDKDPHDLEPFCQVISEKVHHGKFHLII
ncbi:F-box domain containing protein, partial [Trema orientale]